jgi:hypothetical protein
LFSSRGYERDNINASIIANNRQDESHDRRMIQPAILKNVSNVMWCRIIEKFTMVK